MRQQTPKRCNLGVLAALLQPTLELTSSLDDDDDDDDDEGCSQIMGPFWL